MLVDVADVVTAAVEAIVVDNDGEGIGILNLFAVVGHGGYAAAGGSAGVNDIAEAVAVDDIIIGKAACDAVGAVLVGNDLGGGALKPGAYFLAAHGDLVEPVLVAVKAEHIAKLDIACRDEVCGIAGGKRSGDGELSRGIVALVIGSVFAGAVVCAPDLDLVYKVNECRRSGAEAGGGEVAACLADGLEHVVVPGCCLIRLKCCGNVCIRLVECLRNAAFTFGHRLV